MAGFNYTRSQATADRLLRRFGNPSGLTFTKKTPSGSGPSHNPGEPQAANYTVQGVVLPAKATGAQGDEMLDAAMVLQSMRKLIISAKDLATTPAPNDTLTFEGAKWNVTSVTPLNPAGVKVLYNITVERLGAA